ncbi:MAG: PAS domain S-box protein [Nitrosarchaeum sp.]|nr:MAG: PAS domain S-box protein [Nitrosarchaeum sp.]
MIRESLPRNFILVLFCTVIVFLAVIVLYVQDQIKIQTEIIESERFITINQIASRTELRINNAISILEILSKNPHIVNPPSATLIDEKMHGIPEDIDVNRRNAMRETFDYYGGFQNMLFLLPNGDVYINEPFLFQKNMTASNFAFRDWYKEIIATKDVVVSDVVVSKSSNKPNVVIAVPVFSQDKLFQGILTGSLNLDLIEEKLDELKLYANERILIVDDTRTVVADSEHILKGQSVTLGVGAIEASFSDKRGTVIGTINGTKMFVAYNPIKIGQNTWAIISIESYDDTFSTINKTIEESLFLIALVIVIFSVSLFTVHRYFRIQFKLRKQAEDTNAEIVKIQNHLLKSEERYKNLYHLSPDAIVVFDKSGTIISYNESFARLFGYSLGELNGKSIFAIVSDNHLDLAHSYFDEIQKIGTIENKENWLKKKDGTIFPSLFSVSTMYDDRIEYICIIKDISEIHNMQKKLKDASNTIQEQLDKLKGVNKIKDEFSAMVTHELKTPLMPIMWHCNLLKKDMAGVLNSEQLESIESIEKNAKQLELLISDIMDARKLDLNKMKFNFESISLDEFFSNLDHAYKIALADKGISFKTRYPSGVTIHTDKTRLRQVFDNLIGNSIKFVSQDTGIIEIVAERKDNELIISIKDNGQGIPLEKQKELFQKFYQVDTSERRKSSGTGLGLAISKGIMEGLGGSIRLESDGKTGTTIHLSLPLRNF